MQSFLREGPVRLIGRLGRVERLNNEQLVVKRANRVGFEFDAVNARAPIASSLAAIEARGAGEDLALLKVLTTYDRFHALTEQDLAREGDWYLLELDPRGKLSGPLAWSSSLVDGGYREDTRLVLRRATWLFHDDEAPLRPLSSTVTEEREMAQAIAAACGFPAAAIRKGAAAKALLAGLPTPHDALVHDVGQASFVSLRQANGGIIAHLDAGWPISWNRKTAPKKPPALKGAGAPVILSHWDWDHLHGYHAISGLSAGIWVVPIQKLGPGAKRVATTLADANRLYGVTSRRLLAGAFRVGRCRGLKGNSNQTGLAIRISLASQKQILFVGDADYDLAPSVVGGAADLLVATHHGAAFDGAVPMPKAHGAQCVVSVGAGNTYGHPSEKALKQHGAQHWTISFTCKWDRKSRGSRVLM